MWAELETGSSSAGPWTMPSAERAAVGTALDRFAQAPLVPVGSGARRPRGPAAARRLTSQ